MSHLSTGLRRRLVLARALLNDPSIIILDEPTRGLDRESRARYIEKLQQLKAAGATLILATHDLEKAGALCDRAALMDGGRIRALGTLREVLEAGAGLADRLAAGGGRPMPGLIERLARHLAGAASVWLRNATVWRATWKTSLVGAVGEPLFYLLGLGYGLGTVIPAVAGRPYLHFVAPGPDDHLGHVQHDDRGDLHDLHQDGAPEGLRQHDPLAADLRGHHPRGDPLDHDQGADQRRDRARRGARRRGSRRSGPACSACR